MPLLDDRGRLFGRINIIDAALLAFVLLLVPVGYTASRLFRVPKPRIEGVEAAPQAVGSAWRLRVTGRDFRPYLRAAVSKTDQPFSLILAQPNAIECVVRLETPTVLEIELPPVVAGSYDLYLYDETQEVARKTAAFVIPGSVLEVRIRFSVPSDLTKVVKAGDVDVTSRKFAALTGTGTDAAVLKTVRVSSQTATVFEMLLMPEKSRWFGWTQNDAKVIEATVGIPARQSPQGVWEYGELTIRAGDPFLFQTRQYSMRGVIDEVTVTSRGGAVSVPEAGK